MPEYLAPGVYLEETSFRSKSIEGVSTTTTGFIGPARYGPIKQTPDILTSLGDFARIYGGGEQLNYKGVILHNFIWHGVRAFFSEGGKRLYVSRVFHQINNQEYVDPGKQPDTEAVPDGSNYVDGHARSIVGTTQDISIRARFPGQAGNVRLQFVVRLGGKLPRTTTGAIKSGVSNRDLVYVQKRASTVTPNAANLIAALIGTPASGATPATEGATDEAAKIAVLLNTFVDTAIANSEDAAKKLAAAALEVKLREAIFLAEEAAAKLVPVEKDRADAQTIMDGNGTADEKALAKQKRDAALVLIGNLAMEAVSMARNVNTLVKRAKTYVNSNDATTAANAVNTILGQAVTAAGNAVVTGAFFLAKVADNGITLADADNALVPLASTDEVRSLSIRLDLIPAGGTLVTQAWDNISLDPEKTRDGLPDNIFSFFTLEPANQDLARTLPFIVRKGTTVTHGLQALTAIFGDIEAMVTQLDSALRNHQQPESMVTITLSGGNDGMRPIAGEYEGVANPDVDFKTGLKQFEDLEDISIVAAPGYSFGFQNGFGLNARTIESHLINHARTMRYRIAVLDSGDALSISAVRQQRANYDSTHAALYYPWVRVLDPITRQEITLPPSGFVAGIYARNDINRAVWKAPANEVVNLALGFEKVINKAQQEVLNPEGINCFRFFEGRGFLLWGARTISSDSEWKYVNLRRYFAYLEHSIDKGTQWAVFEPNGEALWDNVRRTISDFLLNEWQMGALLGDKPEKAYFVKCDRSTMTQNDLDNGRLICLIGIAPLRPAEFVIFRIGQWTGDRKV